MSKPLRPHWRIQVLADAEVVRLAPDRRIVPSVWNDDEEIVWDADCEGVGRAPWYCWFFLPKDDPTAAPLVPILNAAMARWQAKYDLGVTRR